MSNDKSKAEASSQLKLLSTSGGLESDASSRAVLELVGEGGDGRLEGLLRR